MENHESGSRGEPGPEGPGGARLKRVIILPFFLVIAAGFALSWLFYIDGSRAALRDAVSAIIRASSDRVAEELRGRLGVAAMAARANAAFLGAFPRSDADVTLVRRAFVEQLRLEPMLAILAVGTEEGEYLEAQRLSADSIRVAGAGASTGGTLVFRPVLADGSFGERSAETPGYDPRKRPWYRAAVQVAGPAWSAPYSLYSNTEPVVAATMPVYSGGRLAGVSSVSITLGTLSEYLAGLEETGNGVAFVADAEGRLIAVSRSALLGPDGRRALATDHEDPLVSVAARAASGAGAGDGDGAFSFMLAGMRFLGRSVPVVQEPDLGWSIVLAVAESSYSEKLRGADRRNFFILLAFLGAALFVGWLVVSYITRPIRAIADGVDVLSPGGAVPEELSAFSLRNNELGRLSRSFVAMKRRLDEGFGALEASLRDKDVLLKEVHHRVKNNLQIVSSILSIQAGGLDDERAKAAFEECQNRIQAMALVHEEVYRTGSYAELGMEGYLSRICETLSWGRDRGACETSIAVGVEREAVLSLEKAIPCGLVVNELVTNALKHAFVGRKLGSISVSFRREGPNWRLEVADDGVGLGSPSAPPDGAAGAGIGEQLVTGLVAQLGGSLRREVAEGGGAIAVVVFPV